jgi:hypothetical protein
MSAVAEFDNMIAKLFRSGSDVNREGKYIVKLFDLPSQKWKNYEIDDRLVASGNEPEFAKASMDGEVCRTELILLVEHDADIFKCAPLFSRWSQLWCPLLEKAFAVHAGGWDKIGNGFSPVIALACLTGCTDTFLITNEAKTVGEVKTNIREYKYSSIHFKWDTCKGNSGDAAYNHKCMVFTSKCFTHHKGHTVNASILFDYICEWDTANYIMCADTCSRPGAKPGQRPRGIWNNHVSA